MKNRTNLNLALITGILIVLCLFSVPNIVKACCLNAVAVTTPQGTAVGVSYDDSGGVDRAYSDGNTAGTQYLVSVSLRRWGQCSPDMGCPTGWTVKDKDSRDGANVRRTSTPDPKVSHNIWGITMSKHIFQKYYGATKYYGYTTTESGNKYASSSCWQNGPKGSGCSYP